MIRIATGFFVLLTIAAPALAGDAAWNGARTLLFEPEKYGSYPDDLVMKAGAYIGAPEPLCRGGARTPCWLETENQPGCHVWNDDPQPNETVTWSGACVDGKASSEGRAVWHHGGSTTTFEGGIRAGKMHGYGTHTGAIISRYEGEWRDGKPHGQGVAIWPDGRRYEGEWRDGNLNGRGTGVWPDGTRHEGEWRDGKRHGLGTTVSSEGGRYEGEWSDHNRHGRGTLVWSNGDRYEGEWRNDERNGRGTYTWANGIAETCEWRNNNSVNGTCRRH